MNLSTVRESLYPQIYPLIQSKSCNIHIAIMNEPYLSLILSGKKRIESRFSKKKIAPWKKIKRGDIVFLKKSSGPIVGYFSVLHALFLEIDNELSIYSIRSLFNDSLCIEEDFWRKKNNSKYLSLIYINEVYTINSYYLHEKNRQSWICLGNSFSYAPYQINSNHLICIIGHIGSGKTTISHELEVLMNCNSCSISDFLKTKLAEQGDNCYTRENLQELGKKYIESGWDNFVDEFLIFINNKNISIINGIRHIEFFRSLQKRRTLTLLYLDANDETIHHRLQKRGDSAINYDHIAEGNLNILKPLANYCLNTNSKSPFLCALELLDFILREEKSNCLI